MDRSAIRPLSGLVKFSWTRKSQNRRRRILPRRNKHTTDHSRNRTTNKTRNGSKSRLSLLVIKPRRIRIW